MLSFIGMVAPARDWDLVRQALRILAFPGVLLGATGILLLVQENGVPSPLLFPVLVASSMAAVALLERVIPYDESWNRSRGDVAVDLAHNIVSGFMTVEVARFLLLLALVPAAGWLSRASGSSLWPTTWPLAAQLALAVIASEPLQYWYHRMEHERDRLWSLHAVHHSAQRLYWLNTVRDHPFGIALQFTSQFVPLIVLGCPEGTIQAWGLFSAIHGMLQHSNVDMLHGPFHWIFSTADLHRWHHSPRMEEANHNYGALLIGCDLLFGTYSLPRRAGLPRIRASNPCLAFPRPT
jgi:sterol desaturase/sphingolipid hydroxylase (fatty acid hydroxylase superfamily)